METRKIKILQFTLAASMGGRSKYVLRNWDYIDKERFQFDFVTFSQERLVVEDQLEKQNCVIHHISCYPRQNLEQFIKEFDAVLDCGYDAIHIHTSWWESTIVEELARKKGIKVIIVHSHNSSVNLSDEQKRIGAIEKHNKIKSNIDETLATHYFSCSRPATEWLFGDRISRDRIKELKIAIDLDEFSYKQNVRTDMRRKLAIEHKFVIGILGKFVLQKNHKFLFDVFAQLRKSSDKYVLFVMGDGPLEKELREYAKSLELGDSIVFWAAENEASEFYQMLDMFCLSSFFEGFPAVLVEAQATGLPCLISDAITKDVCITDIVERMPLDEELWSKYISNYDKGYERRGRYQEMTNAGFNIREQIKEIEDVYISAVKEAGR